MIKVVPGIDAVLVDINHVNINARAVISHHSHGRAAHIAGADAANVFNHGMITKGCVGSD
jgi:hypothetical protein